MDKKQREYYLREQLKAIKTELGEKEESGGRGRGVPHQGPRRRAPARGAEGGRARARATGAHAPVLGRVHGGDHLPGLADGAALAHRHRGHARHQDTRAGSWTTTTTGSKSPSGASSSTWPCASSSRTPRGRSCASSAPRARARPRSASRSHAPSAASSTACRSAACATRPRSAATAAPTSGAHAGPRHPGHPARRVDQPRLHAGRNRQAGGGLPRGPVLGAARGPGPGAEPLVPGPLPGRPVRPVEGDVHRDGQRPGHGPARAAGPHGSAAAAGLHRRTRRCTSPSAT